jgi:hypothetical protein
MQYDQDYSEWLTYKPNDPLNQVAAAWHPYPTFGSTPGSKKHSEPNYAPQVYSDIQKILAAGIPVIATETGDRNTPGTKDAPLVSNITNWADQNGVSVVGWGWDVWGNDENVLIKDGKGTPTDGYGTVFRDWLLSHKQSVTVGTTTPTSTPPANPPSPRNPDDPPPPTTPTTTPTTSETYRQPYIQNFSPASGPVGTVVTFYGHDFTGVDVAWMGTNHSIPVKVISDTEVEVKIPPGAQTGQIGILNPENASFAATNFTVTEAYKKK